MVKLKTLLSIISLSACLAIQAQKIKTVSASYTFYAPETMSIEEAKRVSLQRTQIEAIANEFGTIIGQNNTIQTRNLNGSTKIDFSSLRWSDIKGEWIETIGQPQFDIRYDNHLLIVKCDVIGKAREINRAVIDILAKPLKNGTDLRYEAYNFKDGDDLFLFLESPVDGYIAVYLLDEHKQVVYNILPYKTQNSASAKVIANKGYVFFSKEHGDKIEGKNVDEYTLTSEGGREFNTLYILFSTTEIGKQLGFGINDISLPRNISYKDFQIWLSKSLSRDKDMHLIKYSLTIDK